MAKVLIYLSFYGMAISTLVTGLACRDDGTTPSQPSKVAVDEATCEAIWEELLEKMKQGDNKSARELLDRSYECESRLPVELLKRSEIALQLGRPELAYSDGCRVVRMDAANGFGYSLIIKSVNEIQNPSQEQIETANSAKLILGQLEAADASGGVQKYQTPSESRGEDGP